MEKMQRLNFTILVFKFDADLVSIKTAIGASDGNLASHLKKKSLRRLALSSHII